MAQPVFIYLLWLTNKKVCSTPPPHRIKSSTTNTRGCLPGACVYWYIHQLYNVQRPIHSKRANVHKSTPQMSRRGGQRDKGLILIYCRVRVRFDPLFTIGDTAETGSAASEGWEDNWDKRVRPMWELAGGCRDLQQTGSEAFTAYILYSKLQVNGVSITADMLPILCLEKHLVFYTLPCYLWRCPVSNRLAIHLQ